MSSKNLVRRVARLEAWLTPTNDNEQVLRIIFTTVGKPDEIIELRGIEPVGRRRSWQRKVDAIDDNQCYSFGPGAFQDPYNLSPLFWIPKESR